LLKTEEHVIVQNTVLKTAPLTSQNTTQEAQILYGDDRSPESTSCHPMTVYVSSVQGSKTNTSYPFAAEIKTIDDLKKAVVYDHVCARYADGKNNRGKQVKAYRSKKTFRSSDCLPMDCDNTNPNPLEEDIAESDWKTPEDVRTAFPNVPFYVVYSRNHMKEKGGKPARPRFHIYFPMQPATQLKEYGKLKAKVQQHFPAFDDNAIDSARFFFGVEDPKVEYYAGDTMINDFIYRISALPETIPSGSRNATLLSYGAKMLKRFGDTEKAREMFDAAAARCDDPLDNAELNRIWSNSVSFYHSTVETDPMYQSPETFDRLDDLENRMITSSDINAALNIMGIQIRLDVITGQADIRGMPEEYSKSNSPNTLPTLIQDFFSRKGIHVTRQIIDDSLVLIEDANRFNPVEEMLRSGIWDGTDRISRLAQILGIDSNRDFVIYLTKWLHQCVALALNSEEEPYGADGVFVIQAPQGSGKTLFCRTVAMKSDWFAEGLTLDLDNKDSIIQATGKWISELGELDSTLKREQSALKAFITSAKDTYRQPYAKVAVNKPRRTSFCATVNPKEFLNDETGSRRYWVVEPTHIDLDALKMLDTEWLTQLWAQVFRTLFLPDPQGFRLTAEERARLQKENEQYSKPLAGEIEVLERLHWEVPVEHWQWKKASELANDLSLKGVTASQMGKVLAKLMAHDDRIRCKTPHNRKQYLVPPMWLPHTLRTDVVNDETDDLTAFADDVLPVNREICS